MKEGWTYSDFIQKIYLITGLDLNSYKDRQMERRIRQLMSRKNHSFKTLYSELAANEAEKQQFLKYLTINTSGFFRDAHIYDYLTDHVLTELLREHEMLNIWSAGCSTGEEPYTLSMIIHELKAGLRARILASDIDRSALETAKQGRYYPRQLERVAPALISKYFELRDGHYYFRNRYKLAVKFRQHNLLAPAKEDFPPMQLILCRNVFIYFKMEVQERLITRFTRLLAPGGYFVTGCAEMLSQPQRFGLERKIPAVYQKVTEP